MSMITAAYAQAFPAVAAATAGISTRTGTLTASSATIADLSTTADLAVGMSVTGNGIPEGAVILTIASGTTITISQNATETGSRALTFPVSGLITQLIAAAQAAIEKHIGWPVEEAEAIEYYSGNGQPDLPLRRWHATAVEEVRLDQYGAWGQKSGSFGDGSLLAVGEDYALNVERHTSTGEASLLRYLGRAAGGDWGGLGGWMTSYGRGTLTPAANRGPGWPFGQGNLKVTYTAGWTAEAMPADLKQACVNLVQFLALTTGQGGMQTVSESLGKYSYTLGSVNMADVAGNALAAAGELGTTRQLLSRYVDLPI
jgi:hypothetical protein